MRKTHWIRKHYSSNPLFSLKDSEIKKRAFYDAWSVCGLFSILDGTVFKKKVTCKTCLAIMRKINGN